ncbi:proline-rich protein 11 [Trichomycterus rosablanca]|uniref:proline-rich protein 11 n=1 Tax=Trichomycterus rosablanca TaxID=2290929 RepID=UPI002F3589C8
MEELQSELRLLRSNGLMPQGCKCNCGQSDDVKPQQHQLSSVAPPLLPPPPPPPPPLPLPPTPSAPTIKAPEKPSIPKKRTQSTLQEKQDGCAVVTLKDLQAVQLRKVSAHKKIRSPDGTRSPLITLADLQKVRLRRTQFSITTPTRRSLSLSRTPSPVKLHLQLRKVHSVRRSGNTPLCNKENVMKE